MLRLPSNQRAGDGFRRRVGGGSYGPMKARREVLLNITVTGGNFFFCINLSGLAEKEDVFLQRVIQSLSKTKLGTKDKQRRERGCVG